MNGQASHGHEAATPEGPAVGNTPASSSKKWIVLRPGVEDWEHQSEEERDAEAGRLYEAVIAALSDRSQKS